MIESDRKSGAPLGDQVVAGLSQQIEEGRLVEGARLPSVRQLAARLGVSAFTIVNAYDRLVSKGLIDSRPGAGYYVCKRRRHKELADIEGVSEAPLTALGFAMNALDQSEDSVPAGSGFLPTAWLAEAIPPQVIGRLVRDAAATGLPAPAQGLPAFRRRLAEKLLQQGIPAAPRLVVTTFGASHAFSLLLRARVEPGDTVLVEDPGYLVLHAQLLDFGVRLLPVPRLPDGPDLDALEEAAKAHRPRLFFTQTILHNPTGGNTSAAKCHRLLTLADRYDFDIVEDDVYGDLAGTQPLRLARLDEFRRVFYVSSFTKLLNPALRVGFVVSPPQHVGALVERKLLDVLSGSALQEAIVGHVLESGRYAKHALKTRNRVSKARAVAEVALAGAGVEIEDRNPDGMFIWGRVPGAGDMDDLVRQATERNILMAKGGMFSPSGGYRDYLRFNAAYSADPRLMGFLAERTGAKQVVSNVRPFPSVRRRP